MTGLRTGSLFSSGGGWEVGAVRAGFVPSWGVELDAERAKLWNDTFPTAVPGCLTGDVRDAQLLQQTTPVDVLFTSPVCRDFSRSRSRVDGANVDSDRPTLGLATLDYVRRLCPPVVMLENVTMYAQSAPYTRLVQEMSALGYSVQARPLNAADFGNPSARPRLIAVFIHRSSGVTFNWPQPTGRVNWDVALSSVLPTLPEAPPTGALDRSLAAWRRVGLKMSYPAMFVAQKQRILDYTPDYIVPRGKVAPTLVVGTNAVTSWRVLLGPQDIRRLNGVSASVLNGFLVAGKFPESYGAGYKDAFVANVAADAVSPIMSEALLRNLVWPSGYVPQSDR